MTFIINFVLPQVDLLNDMTSKDSMPRLSIYPNSGISTENIEVQCEISRSTLSNSRSENIYISVKTDHVKPSGILLMFDDKTNQCRSNREVIYIDICNSTLILIRINHTILNDTLKTIDYSCTQGITSATNSYRIISK